MIWKRIFQYIPSDEMLSFVWESAEEQVNDIIQASGEKKLWDIIKISGEEKLWEIIQGSIEDEQKLKHFIQVNEDEEELRDIIRVMKEKEIVKLFVYYKCKCIDLRNPIYYYYNGKRVTADSVNFYDLDFYKKPLCSEDFQYKDLVPPHLTPNRLLNFLMLHEKVEIRFPERSDYNEWSPLIIILPSDRIYRSDRLHELKYCNRFYSKLWYFVKVDPITSEITCIKTFPQVMMDDLEF